MFCYIKVELFYRNLPEQVISVKQPSLCGSGLSGYSWMVEFIGYDQAGFGAPTVSVSQAWCECSVVQFVFLLVWVSVFQFVIIWKTVFIATLLFVCMLCNLVKRQKLYKRFIKFINFKHLLLLIITELCLWLFTIALSCLIMSLIKTAQIFL